MFLCYIKTKKIIKTEFASKTFFHYVHLVTVYIILINMTQKKKTEILAQSGAIAFKHQKEQNEAETNKVTQWRLL